MVPPPPLSSVSLSSLGLVCACIHLYIKHHSLPSFLCQNGSNIASSPLLASRSPFSCLSSLGLINLRVHRLPDVGVSVGADQARNMKSHIPLFHLLLITFLISVPNLRAARLMPPLQFEGVKVDMHANMDPEATMQEANTWELMGLEDCEKGDEECLKRRVISEAHLDYIYTQHHSQP